MIGRRYHDPVPGPAQQDLDRQVADAEPRGLRRGRDFRTRTQR